MKKFFFFLGVILLSVPAWGQITGVVLDDTGTPIMGAIVLDPVSGSTATTDMNGSFELNVVEGTEVQVALLGFYSYKTKAKSGMQVVLRSKKGSSSDGLKVFVLANGQTSFPFSPAVGITLGVVKRFGWYLNAMMGFGLHYNHSNVVNNNMEVSIWDYPYYEKPFYTGKRSDQLFSVTTGMLARFGRAPMYMYLGAGYGYKSVTYETNNYLWLARYTDRSNDMSPFHSLCVETGLLFNIKGFAISAGYEAMIGVAHPRGQVSCAHALKIGVGGIFDCKRRTQK